MSAAGPSGLSQRRRPAGGGAAGSSMSGGDYDEGSGSNGHSYESAGSSLKHRNTPSVSAGGRSGFGGGGASGAGGPSTPSADGHHRIAFDPRDLKDEEEEMYYPKLTLMEETLLLGLKDRQGYLSFWNDSISYSLRGCIILELIMRRRLNIVKDSGRIRLDIQDRLVEVINPKMTGEVLLDEALKLIKSSEEKRSVAEWVDLLSGETWNLSKIGYQLKQVRERLAKGLVDKGILRTEKRNFLLFDMATHPIADASAKKDTLRRVTTLSCGTSTARVPTNLYTDSSDIFLPITRSLVLVCCAFAANVLDNALLHLDYESRESTFQKVEDWLEVFGSWPMAAKYGGIGSSMGGGGSSGGIGSGSSGGGAGIGSTKASQRMTNRNNASSNSNTTSNGSGRADTGGARIGEGSVLPSTASSSSDFDPMSESSGPSSSSSSAAALEAAHVRLGISTADLVREVRNEAATAPDGMFEAIAAVLAVLARMDSLL